MSDKDFPGFEDPAPAPTPPPAAPPAQPPPLQSYAFEEDTAPAAPVRKPNPLIGSATAGPVPTPAPAAPPPRAPSRPAPAPEPPAEDVVPGSAKDLWKCPHCGAGNKPARTTCRACGKSPQAAVARPWFLQMPTLIGVPVVLAAAVGLWIVTRPDLTLRPAQAGVADAKPRTGGGREADRTIDGRTFTPRHRIAVTGRVVGTRPHPSVSGVTTVILALGNDALDPTFGQLSLVWNGDVAEISGGRTVTLHLVGEVTIPAPGQYFGLTGRRGDLADGMAIIRSIEGDAVVPDQTSP